jgi:hypothetical protein
MCYHQAGTSVEQGLVPVISVDSIHGDLGRDVVPMSVHNARGCGIVENADKPTYCIDKGLQILLRRMRELVDELVFACSNHIPS